jgi:hypothetical protein
VQAKEQEIAASSISPQIIPTSIPEQVIALFYSIESMLFDIYCFYFSHEKSSPASIEDMCVLSTNAAFQFIYDFDICPGVISRPLSYYLIHSIIENDITIIKVKPKHDIGKLLTFAKYMEFLLLCGIHSKGSTSYNLFGMFIIEKN